MKKLEITLTNPLHSQLQRASKRANKPINQFVQELLERISEEMDAELETSSELLAEGYQAMAQQNAETVHLTLAAQLVALEKSGEPDHDFNSTR